MALKAHPDLNLDTSIITKNIVPISKKVSRLMNMTYYKEIKQSLERRFAHSSGIHQDGF